MQYQTAVLTAAVRQGLNVDEGLYTICGMAESCPMIHFGVDFLQPRYLLPTPKSFSLGLICTAASLSCLSGKQKVTAITVCGHQGGKKCAGLYASLVATYLTKRLYAVGVLCLSAATPATAQDMPSPAKIA